MPFEWANADSIDFMTKGNYLQNGETVEQRFRDMADYAHSLQPYLDYAEKFFEYAGRGFYSIATPIQTNFGRHGLPISCNNSHIEDSISGIWDKLSEIAVMTKHGAGTSGYFGDIRPMGAPISSGGVADGPVHFAMNFNATVVSVNQGDTRRGNMGAYLPIEHPDAAQWLKIRQEGHPIQNLSPGVTITDEFMQRALGGDEKAQKLMAELIRSRYEKGYPYIVFHDTVNRNKPQVYKDLGLEIRGSNLCTEIFQPSTTDLSYSCCLSSINLTKIEEILETDAIEVLTWFLDCVIEDYIRKTAGMKHMQAAHRSAQIFRAIGVGSLGLHSALQERNLAFGSMEARYTDGNWHAQIDRRTRDASAALAAVFGEPEAMTGYGQRNATRMAIAPTTSSAFILGQVSQSIEPMMFNYGTHNLAKGKYAWRNPNLKRVLESMGQDTEEVWMSILEHHGSVAHLSFLDDHQKAVFAIFPEISGKDVINHAAYRQRFIDQGQSINLMIHPKTPAEDVLELIVYAWENGIKSLYYQHGKNLAAELHRDALHCSMCEG